ncbi:MAG: Spy/CpxP family protein refolding chaperone [Proteobacteria bacterium]|jgi:periplasmic protein CpxP/Spy|nr:hypothetical protein [Methylibium sp.]MBY0367978.1 Spy/CpxP family protein refolding chaperone [Burkholderiaceae bacterium]MCH8854893.1 Spy/CpxP family protein refolding chaperone [Pseudomonadota bacterium]|mmetsp:Transcript_10445/g.42628  ORF Transcript_10445/g.42628 Transcript_10445/m.42628 type:complete len:160 (+) Transcript_10445:1864-2343(+)
MNANRTRSLLRVALAAAVLAVGGAAQAQAGPEPFEGRGLLAAGLVGDHLDHWLDLVNATDAQRSQISAIFKAARQDLAGQRDAGRKLREQMATLYGATNVDAVAIESVRAQIGAQREIASKRLSQASIEAARVLSPEQRAKLVDIVKKREARMAARHAA